jgi:hypothetical protein
LSGYGAASLLLNYGEPSASSLLALASGLWRFVDWQVTGMLAVFLAVAIVLRSPGLSRALWIYTLGVSLIAVYGSLQAACVLFRLSQATSEALFARVDAVVAPFVVTQVGLLRSVFVKFAQYFGGRSDVVSPIWTNLLSQLHDACPASSEEYVRTTLEQELGEVMHGIVGTDERSDSGGGKKKFVLEDVFEAFERVPIASASIGQVHTATLKHAVIMQILHAQQQEAQQSCTQHSLAGEVVGTLLSAQTTHDSDGDADGSSAHFSSPLPAPRILSSTSTPVDTADGHRTAPANGAAEGGDAADLNWYESATDATFTCASSAEASQLVSVVVKVQHEGIAPLMVADMQIVLVLIKWAARIDSRWQVALLCCIPCLPCLPDVNARCYAVRTDHAASNAQLGPYNASRTGLPRGSQQPSRGTIVSSKLQLTGLPPRNTPHVCSTSTDEGNHAEVGTGSSYTVSRATACDSESPRHDPPLRLQGLYTSNSTLRVQENVIIPLFCVVGD